jgi:hypothetical protein
MTAVALSLIELDDNGVAWIRFTRRSPTTTNIRLNSILRCLARPGAQKPGPGRRKIPQDDSACAPKACYAFLQVSRFPSHSGFRRRT